MRSLSILSPILIAFITACGSSGSDEPQAPTETPPIIETYDEVGIFDINYGQFYGVYVFLEDGEFYGIHYVFGDTLAGHPRGSLSSENSTGNLESIAWANFIDDAQMLGVQEPSPTFGRSFTGDDQFSATIRGSFGQFSANSQGQKAWNSGSTETLYHNPIELSALANDYTGISRSVGIDEPMQNISDFSLDDSGNFSATANRCTYNGVLNTLGNTGVYNATATVSGNECAMPSTLSGVLIPLEYDGDSIEIALMLNNEDQTHTAVFIVEN